MRLNLGCGFQQRRDGNWVNVDKYSDCHPDMVWDLEQFPWPWEDNSVDEVLLKDCLEHLGQQTHCFLKIMQELYRVCKDGAIINIVVPHPLHDDFFGDPSHVRPITAQMLSLFNKDLNRTWIATGRPATPFGIYLDIDFVVTRNVEHRDSNNKIGWMEITMLARKI